MNRKEKLQLLSKEVKEIAGLLAGISECEMIPRILLDMLEEKSKNLAESIGQLKETDRPETCEREIPTPTAAPIRESEVQFVKKETTPVSRVAETARVVETVPVTEKETVHEPQHGTTAEERTRDFFPKVFQEYSSANTHSVKSATDIRKLLSLNDRFLFQRELFHGDVGMMNYVLDEVNAMTSFEQAQQFIAQKFQWEAEASGVTEFVTLLEHYFNSKNS